MLKQWPFRIRLLVGHILPIILFVPLVGLALTNLLEIHLILPGLARELIDQGTLVIRIAKDHPEVWNSSSAAQALLASIHMSSLTQVSLLEPDQVLLAISPSAGPAPIGKVVQDLPPINQAPDVVELEIRTGGKGGGRMLDVLVPVFTEEGVQEGLIRISRPIGEIDQNLNRVYLLILGLFVAGMAISGGMAVYISEGYNHALLQLTQAIASAPLEGKAKLLVEPDEKDFKPLARTFNRLQVRREELEETRSHMLINLVHEMGRPLGSLRTAVHALDAGALENIPLRDDLLKGMSERIDRMGRLLEDLALTYRRLAPHEINLRTVDLGAWLSQVGSMWGENAHQKQLEWSCVTDAQLPVFTTDPERLSQALSNLVENAFKFTPAGGRVTLTIRKNDRELLMEVHNTGPVIPAEEQTRLFTPFYRIVKPTWKVPGLGLGLSISRSIVESLGGVITLESTAEQGTTFTIHHPL